MKRCSDLTVPPVRVMNQCKSNNTRALSDPGLRGRSRRGIRRGAPTKPRRIHALRSRTGGRRVLGYKIGLAKAFISVRGLPLLTYA